MGDAHHPHHNHRHKRLCHLRDRGLPGQLVSFRSRGVFDELADLFCSRLSVQNQGRSRRRSLDNHDLPVLLPPHHRHLLTNLPRNQDGPRSGTARSSGATPFEGVEQEAQAEKRGRPRKPAVLYWP